MKINILGKWFRRDNIKKDDIEQAHISLAEIESKIGYKFSNNKFLVEALWHRSYQKFSSSGTLSNERMEFLGDAVLDVIVTEHLYKTYTSANEGDLSQKKAILISRKLLGKIINEAGLGEYLILNKGEEKTGGRNKLSNLANLFESLLGAIYLDGGLDAAKKFVSRFLLKRENEFLKSQVFANYKSILLEFSQAHGWGFPKYQVISEEGPDHRKNFRVSVNVNSLVAEGSGPNKKTAEQNSARNALKKLKTEFSNLTVE